jgi:hypothetical protein
MNLIYADGLQGPEHATLHEQTRRLTDQFLMLCLTVSNRPQDGLELMEQLFTQAHGYGAFYLDGVFTKQGYSKDVVVRKSTEAARAAIQGRAKM